jgi:hypothetical protein
MGNKIQKELTRRLWITRSGQLGRRFRIRRISTSMKLLGSIVWMSGGQTRLRS